MKYHFPTNVENEINSYFLYEIPIKSIRNINSKNEMFFKNVTYVPSRENLPR